MADGVVLNSGTGGATAATDDCGASGHAQVVKLAISTDGSATLIPAEATNGLDVDVTRVVPGTSATQLGKAEDAASASGDTGLLALAVRRDAAAVGVDADGDYAALSVDSTGHLYTSAAQEGTWTVALSATDNAVLDSIDSAVNGTLTVGSHAVTNAGTFATQVDGAALTALQTIDNPVFADDAAFTLGSSSVSVAGAIRDDALSTLTAVEGDAVPLRVSSTGALHVTGGGGGTQYSIDDAGPTVVTMAGVVRDDSLTTLTEVDGDATVLRVNSTGALHVTGGGGGTEYTEDVATANPIVGTATLMERDDALATVTPIEGDWIGLRGTAEGALWTQDFNSDAILADTGTIAGDTTSIDSKITACNTGAVVLAAGTAAFGKLSANSGVDIGDVDVTSIVPGSGATNLGKAEDAAHATGDVGVMALSVRQNTAASTSGTDGDYQPLITDTNGRLHVITGPSTGTIEVVGDVAQDAAVAGNPILNGARASTATPTAMSADGDAVHLWATRNGALVVAGRVVDDAAFGVATDRVQPSGFLADETSTDSVDEGDAGIARMTLDRKQVVTQYVHAAAGGWSPYKNVDVDEAKYDIKTSAGKLGWLHVINRSTGVRYLKFYDLAAASVTVGTTTPVLSFPVPTMADTNGAGFTINFGDAGVQFSTAICVVATTGVADSDTGAPGANDVVLNCGYI